MFKNITILSHPIFWKRHLGRPSSFLKLGYEENLKSSRPLVFPRNQYHSFWFPNFQASAPVGPFSVEDTLLWVLRNDF